jgi:hypothetical protein
MPPEPEARSSANPESLEFAEPPVPQTIELLPPLERSPRPKPSIDAVPKRSPVPASEPDSTIDPALKPGLFAPLTAEELRPARIRVGLGFVGASACTLFGLWAYIKWFYAEFGLAESMSHFWYPYTLFIGLGVAGFFMLGREALRPQPEDPED